jgi:hypothetical protein
VVVRVSVPSHQATVTTQCFLNGFRINFKHGKLGEYRDYVELFKAHSWLIFSILIANQEAETRMILKKVSSNIKVIGIVFTVPPIYMPIWVSDSLFKYVNFCEGCGSDLSISHHEIVEIDYNMLGLEKVMCDACLLRRATEFSEMIYEA